MFLINIIRLTQIGILMLSLERGNTIRHLMKRFDRTVNLPTVR